MNIVRDLEFTADPNYDSLASIFREGAHRFAGPDLEWMPVPTVQSAENKATDQREKS